MGVKHRGGWLVPWVAVVSLGAAGQQVPLVVRQADTGAVRAPLHKQIDVNTPDADGTTALHWATHRDDLDTVELLIRAGANVKAANRYGVTPLALACVNGNASIIERLLKAGADPNSAQGEGETALMTAARTGKADAVRVLIAHGADVKAKERFGGQTALMWAAMENHAAAAKVLIEAGADVHARSNGGFTPLLFAARAGHIQTTQVLLGSGADVNETLPDGMSALVLAVVNAHYEFAASLLAHGADPNADAQGWTALHQLVWTRRPNKGFANPGPVPTGTLSSLELAQKLVADGADPNSRQKKEPRDGYRNMLNRIGATPFLLAAKSADVELMRVLVANGADPQLPTADRTTPLMAAAGVGIWNVGESPGTNDEALEAVKLCLELGGDATAADANGYTALHGAAHRGSPAIVQLLVDKGAKLDAKLTKGGRGAGGWQEGWTPLTIAEGVFYAASFKRELDTAALLRQLMKERNLSTDVKVVGSGTATPTISQTPR
jgi:ankyrin repeat protein